MFTLVPLSLALSSALIHAQEAQQPGLPETPRDNVVDTIHGHQITDAYRWLEDAHSPQTQKWVAEEQHYTESVLSPLPQREQIRQRLTELAQIGVIGTPQVGGNRYFHTRREGKQNQPVLYVREGVNGADRVLVDVNALAADGTVALDWYYPTHDGKYVAYGTSPSGSEISTLHVIDTATGKHLTDQIERTRAASIAWKRDDSGFYYTRYPKPGDVAPGQEMYNRHVFYHQLGSDAAHDPEIFGAGRDAQDWPNVSLSEDDRWLTIGVEQGWAKSEVFLLDVKSPGAKPVRVTDGKEFLYSGFVRKGTLYLMTNEDAPRFKVLTAPAAHPERANWKPLIGQSEDVLAGLDYIGGKLVATYDHIATSLLRVFRTSGELQAEIPLPTLGSITGVGGLDDGSEAFFTFTSFITPTTAYRYDLKSAHSEVWKKLDTSIAPEDYEVKQVFYPSKDGTKVPMFIVNKKGAVHGNGKNTALLTGYGGFNVSNTPYFSPSAFLWLENGGVYAVANLRGGAEHGEDWHRAGMLDKKQNVFDDFIAAGEYLISQKYTMKQHLAIYGGSNGGLLVGASHHAASGSVACRRLRRAAARYAALSALPDRQAVDPRVWQR